MGAQNARACVPVYTSPSVLRTTSISNMRGVHIVHSEFVAALKTIFLSPWVTKTVLTYLWSFNEAKASSSRGQDLEYREDFSTVWMVH